MLTQKELKVLRLALDASAPDGEWINAAVMLFKALRKRGADAQEFEHPGNNGLVPVDIPPTKPDYGLVFMPWGKHKGKMFKDIAPSYLVWALDWIRSDPKRAKDMKQLADAIEAFLNQ